jgi:pilus assembly protein TadC
MLEFLLLLAVLSVFLLVNGALARPGVKRESSVAPAPTNKQYRARSIGNLRFLDRLALESAKRALRMDRTNERYLRLLKKANWFWDAGEPFMPNPKAPFWNLESLWGEKLFGAVVYGGFTGVILLIVGVLMNVLNQTPMLPIMLGAVAIGGAVAFFSFSGPDGTLSAAAVKRQQELTLEMGFRIPELRGDVLAGNTIQRAIRNMSRRPGGPFVEELRRVVVVLDVTKDDLLAMDQLIERNQGNELVVEFANNLKMVSRQGGQISPVLNVLADMAQQRLRLNIQTQARKNLQEMTRPIGLSSMVITSMLLIVPAIIGVMGSLGQ